MVSDFVLQNWQLVLCSIVMIVGAFIDGWKLKVPNWLTFSMILSGWAYWTFAAISSGDGSLAGATFGGCFLAGGLLLPFYAVGGMGGGDVKLYAGFGTWTVPLQWFGYNGLLWAFAVSVLLGAAMAIIRVWWEGTLTVNLINAQDILRDWMTSKSVKEVAERAKERKPKLQLLPYGIPLTIGSLAYIAFIFPSAAVAITVTTTTGF